MTYLLDTHYVIWAVMQTEKISPKINKVLSDPDNRIIVSAISFWEIALKESIGKLNLIGYIPEDFSAASIRMGFEIQPLSEKEASTYHHLRANHHKDPFDRMLVWQAITNGYTLISVDDNIKKYISEGLKIYSE